MQWSIVMPVYNEEAVIEKVVESFQEKVLSKLEDVEFILINDASRDGTAAILDRLAKEKSQLRIIHMDQNGGHGKALLAGYRASVGQYVFHCDSDNQHDPSDFWKLAPHIKTHDVVLGIRSERHDPLSRRLISATNKYLCTLLFGSHLKDHNTPFKIYSRMALDLVLGIVEPLRPFAPSIEMALTANTLKLKIAETPVRHLPRLTGEISIVRWKLLKVCFETVGNLWQLRRQLKKLAHAG